MLKAFQAAAKLVCALIRIVQFRCELESEGPLYEFDSAPGTTHRIAIRFFKNLVLGFAASLSAAEKVGFRATSMMPSRR